MRVERLWYRASVGLLKTAPRSLAVLMGSVALVAWPWLQLWVGLILGTLLSLLIGNLVVLAMTGLFGHLHGRMAALYSAAEDAGRAGDPECAQRLNERADRMRWR